MAVIFSFLKKYRIAAVCALLMMLIELTAELLQPYLISKIIDDGIQLKDLSVVWLWGGVLALSALFAFAAGITSSFFASHSSQNFAYDLRESLYEKVQSFSYSVFNKFATSTLITRLTGDVTQLQDMIFMSLRFATRMPLVVIGSVVMALVVNVKLGLLLTVMVPVLVLFVVYMMKLTTKLFRKAQQRLDEVNGVIQENLIGIRLIRVFVRMGHEVERFAAFSSRLMKDTVSALRLTESMMPFILLLMNASIIILLWVGRLDIASGSATVGQVVAVLNYSLRVIGAMSELAWIMASYSRAVASAQRVVEVLGTDSGEKKWTALGTSKSNKQSNAVKQSQSDLEQMALQNLESVQLEWPSTDIVESRAKVLPSILGHVEFQNVSFRYQDSEAEVLENITFTAKSGQRIAIMGATGSGKSSLIQLIPRLHEPTSGHVRVDGRDISELDSSLLRGAIGYVPQEIVLFSGTIRDNIAWGREDASIEQIEEAARRAQIHDTISNLPSGYDTLLGQRGINLSGGQKQRLSIARALVRQPSILILDDSTSALDLRTEAALLASLEDIACTTFLITQKISSTVSADLILLLDEGKLIASGKHEELMAISALYRRIYESQYEETAHVQSIR